MYFEIYQEGSTNALAAAFGSGGGDWRWRLKAANHEPIASGEGYRNKADCLRAIDLVRSTDSSTPIRAI